MALIPGFIDASAGAPVYDGNGLRLIDSVDLTPSGTTSALESRAGVRPSYIDGLKVTLAGTAWTVAAGVAVISKTATSGAYRVAVNASVGGNLNAADATFARKDIITLRVRDNTVDGSGARDAAVVYTAGVPASSPTAPAVPAGELLLATIDVPKSGSGSPTATDARVFTVASGGVLPTKTRPSNPYVGQTIYRTDIGCLETYAPWGEWIPDNTAAPYLRMQRVAAQSIPATTETLISWDTTIENMGFAPPSGGTITMPRRGVYRIDYKHGGSVAVNTMIHLGGYKNGSTFINFHRSITGTTAAAPFVVSGSVTERFNAGDTFGAFVFSGAHSTFASSVYCPDLTITWLRS